MMGKNKHFLAGLIVLLVLFGIVTFCNPAWGIDAEELGLILKPDLSIGIEDGDENYIFGDISRISLDGAGNIYVLDYKYRVIRIFNGEGSWIRSIAVPSGQGPQEAMNPNGIAVTSKGTLFINDVLKIIVYNVDGTYIRTFKTGFRISSIQNIGEEAWVAIGPNNGKILHIFDETGNHLDSFGDYFPVPKELKQMEGMSLISAPLIFNTSTDGRIFVLNPHKYEITVFKDRKVEEILIGKNELFRPTTQRGRAFMSTAAFTVRSGDFTLVLLSNPNPNAPKILDVFKGGRQIGTLPAKGTPLAVDAHERIYFNVEEDIPKVVRCTLEQNK
jgi:hypothetical protein